MIPDHYADVQVLGAGPIGDFALGAWNERWMMSHEAVRCRLCLAAQWPSNAIEPLQHCAGCDISGDHYPLRELTKILTSLPAVRA